MKSLGRYVIRGEIGRGNMGVVYRGYDPVIDRMVALKTVMLPENLRKEARDHFLERFLLEARVAGKLLHPNIVVTYDAATDETTGIPFIVMELVEGEPLSERLRKRGALPWAEAVQIVVPLAHALQYAHDNGVVHRDIKPANVILTPQGVPKIADFGIAKLPAAEHTQTGTIMGTPYFMSPEQLMGTRLDGRSDIFSLGVLLYCSIAGRRPFDGIEISSIVSQVLYKNPPPISELVPEAPRGLDEVLRRALEKDLDRRYSTAAELVQDLLEVKHGGQPSRPSLAGEKTAVDRVGIVSTERPPAPRSGTLRRSSSRRLPRRALAAAGVVCAGLLVLIFGRGRVSPHKLPLELTATHRHLIGGCSGTLTLQSWGIEYSSEEHGTWQWPWNQIHRLERNDERSLSVETREGDLLGLMKTRRYNFTLTGPGLEDGFWEDYRAIAAASEPAKENVGSGADSRPTGDTAGRAGRQPTETELFHAATLAFEAGDFEESQRNLEELLERNPDFAGAGRLLEEVDVQLWKETLPLSFAARHNHRIGHCTGKLTLTDRGIEYRSGDHELWWWSFGEIRTMERPDGWRLDIETYETELLSMGRPKAYKFMLLDVQLEDQAWRRYRRLAQKSSKR